MSIQSIQEKIENTIIIEKSKFITYLLPVFNIQEIEDQLEIFRRQHKEATHVCYGWILNNNGILSFKSSDDGEPSSTAGAPILNGLKKNHLENILCIVVRYFGGIKLGAGGLSRAYGKSCLEAIKKAVLVQWVEADVYELSIPYNQEKNFLQYLKFYNVSILLKKYELEIIYTIAFYQTKDLLKIKNDIGIELKESFLYKKWLKM